MFQTKGYMRKKERQLKAIDIILERFDDDRSIPNLHAYESYAADHGGPLNLRLRAGALDQIEGDLGAIPRYAIWAETVRGNLVSAEADVAVGNVTDETLQRLRRCINTLSAFSEIQRIFDPVIAK
jgi:hypothetical protein